MLLICCFFFFFWLHLLLLLVYQIFFSSWTKLEDLAGTDREVGNRDGRKKPTTAAIRDRDREDFG